MTNMCAPLGFIADSHQHGFTFTFLRDNDIDIQHDQPVVVWRQIPDREEQARYRGVITEVTPTIAAVMITNQDLPNDWDPSIAMLQPGDTVYLGQNDGSYNPCFRQATEAESREMFERAFAYHQQRQLPVGAAQLMPHHDAPPNLE